MTSVRDRLNRILNIGGATRLDDISGAVTHVIVGDENKASAELKAIKSRGLWYGIVICIYMYILDEYNLFASQFVIFLINK